VKQKLTTAMNRGPTNDDRAIGQRIRLRRQEIGMTQKALANSSGVTFQQIQKYEIGANRVSAGRLARIAEALGVPMVFLLMGTQEEPTRSFDSDLAPLLTFDALRLIRAYNAMNPKARRAFLALAEGIAGNRARQ
jgi:transcriptional regulator with XRE-family HTH domain